jgi:Tfp pilus assembly protein PilN
VIEVHLRPGTKKGSARSRRLALSLPRFGGGGKVPRDPWALAAAAAVLLLVSASGWFLLQTAGVAEELEIRIEAQVRDSIRFEDIIRRSGVLQARRDSIAQRVSIIQEIDGSRYVWSHVMDEVARALPDYTWLTRLTQVTGGGSDVLFRVEGRSGTYFGLTNFMENLEASPFIRGVELLTSEQISVALGGGVNQLVYRFVLEASTREPPPELVDRVPLFGPSVLPPGVEGG